MNVPIYDPRVPRLPRSQAVRTYRDTIGRIADPLPWPQQLALYVFCAYVLFAVALFVSFVFAGWSM